VKSKDTWTLVYSLEEEEFPTFQAAAERMVKRVDIDIQKGMALQILETAIWIEPMGGDMPPIMFYTVRDIAGECGWTDEWLSREKPDDRARLSSSPVE
jgi:hypothetical protein